MGAWNVFDLDEYMNVIDSTWYFKCKRYPDGLIKKFKYRFFGRGNQQLELIGFFETYAPAVQSKKFWLMLIIELLLGFKSNQGDATTAFIHAYIPENEKVYVEIPRGFEQLSNNGRSTFLKLKKKLYGLHHSLRDFLK